MNRRFRFINGVQKFEQVVPYEDSVALFTEVGQQVEEGTLLYSKHSQKIIESHYLPEELEVKLEKVSDYICRVAGEYILPGDQIAEKISVGGLTTMSVHSNSEGIISLKRLKSGYLDIMSETCNEDIVAPIAGKIESIKLNYGITISTSATMVNVHAISSLPKTREYEDGVVSGYLKIIGDGTSVYSKKDLAESYNDCIVYAGKFLYPELADALFERRCRCVIAYSMNYSDFKFLNVPLILTGGFGQIPYDKSILELLYGIKGKWMFADWKSKSLGLLNSDQNPLVMDFLARQEKMFIPELSAGEDVRSVDAETWGICGKIISFSDDRTHAVIEDSSKNRHFLPINVLEKY